MYEMSSFRFILLVAGHSRFLIVDACLRKSCCNTHDECQRVTAICDGKATCIQSSTGKDDVATPAAAFMGKKKGQESQKRRAASFQTLSKLSREVGSRGGVAPLRCWKVACLFLR